jgi:hypothetical protein
MVSERRRAERKRPHGNTGADSNAVVIREITAVGAAKTDRVRAIRWDGRH